MTQDTEDVVARLGADAHYTINGRGTGERRLVNPDGPDAIKLIQSLSDRIDELTRALERIETGECVTDWADQPHEQMQDEARAALHQEAT